MNTFGRGEADWRDGRLVIRRPEIRNSRMTGLYIPQTPEQSAAMAEGLRETVERKRAKTPADREAALGQLAALAALAAGQTRGIPEQPISVEATLNVK